MQLNLGHSYAKKEIKKFFFTFCKCTFLTHTEVPITFNKKYIERTNWLLCGKKLIKFTQYNKFMFSFRPQIGKNNLKYHVNLFFKKNVIDNEHPQIHKIFH